MARIVQAMLCYVYKIFSKIIRHTARTDVQAKTTPFFSRTGFRNNFRKKRAICAQPFFNTLFSARKVGEAMMLGSRKNLIGKCSWGKKKGEFLIFLCFVVRIDQRAWYHWKPRSFVENMF